MNDRNNLLISAAILGISIIICTIIVTSTWKSNSSAGQTITVTGSAKKDIVSDFGILKGSISVQGTTAQDAYRQLESQKPMLISYLESKGFPADKIELFTINSFTVYEIASNGIRTSHVIGYNYNQQIEITSPDVNKIKEVSLDISSLVEKGISFTVEMPEYHYTKLADLKIEIQAAAAKDAMVRAQKIADATNRKLGPMRSARMGVLQITPRMSNQVSDYGVNDLSSIDKEITAVVNASFEIE